jgi:hypothetical protein
MRWARHVARTLAKNNSYRRSVTARLYPLGNTYGTLLHIVNIMQLPVCSPYVQIVADSAVPDACVAVTGRSDARCLPDKITPLDFRRCNFHIKMDLKYGVNENKSVSWQVKWTFLLKTETWSFGFCHGAVRGVRIELRTVNWQLRAKTHGLFIRVQLFTVFAPGFKSIRWDSLFKYKDNPPVSLLLQ